MFLLDNVAQRLGGHLQKQSGMQKMNDSVKTSYSLFPPAPGVAAVAGGDPHNPRSHQAIWTTVTDGLNDIILSLAPWYFARRTEVDQQVALIHAMTSDPKEIARKMTEQRLFMAQGALDSIYVRLCRLVQLAAARGYDTKYKLLADSDPYYLKWKEHPVFQLPTFQSEAFLRFVHRMKEVQQVEVEYNIEVQPQVRNAFEKAVNDRVIPPLLLANAQQNALYTEVQQLRSENQEQRQLLQGICHHLQVPSVPSPLCSPTMPLGTRVANTTTQMSSLTDDSSISFQYTKAGTQRKKAKRRKVRQLLPGGQPLWAPDLMTAEQFWREFNDGLDGRKPLKELEDELGPAWRSDTMIKDVPGSNITSSALKGGWSNRTPIYNYILWRTELQQEDTIDVYSACDEVDEIFQQHLSANGRPKLQACASALRKRLTELGATSLPYPRKKHEVPVPCGTI